MRAAWAAGTVAAALLLSVATADDDRAEPAQRWLVGDLHVHVSPPDAPGHSLLTVGAALDHARRLGLDFVALTPHRAHEMVTDPDLQDATVLGQRLVRRRAEQHRYRTESDPEARPAPAPLVLSGWEWTRPDPGHLGVVFADLDGLEIGDGTARRLVDGGALVIVNHPYFGPVPSDDPLLRRIGPGRLWLPFGDAPVDGDWNAIEVWHDRSVLVERLHAHREDAPPETAMLSRSLAAWDAVTLAARRRITAVGGSDAHGRLPYTLTPLPVTSVLVDGGAQDDAAQREVLRRGLLAARVTFGRDGGAAARAFAATSDVPGEHAGIGESLRARESVTLSWEGTARLVENGRDAGEHEGGATRQLPQTGAFAFWRIEKPREAYSNMIYANLPER